MTYEVVANDSSEGSTDVEEGEEVAEESTDRIAASDTNTEVEDAK